MIYRLYIYSTISATASALAIREINEALKSNSYSFWQDNDVARFMSHFDADALRKQIETDLGDKCHVRVCFAPCSEQTEYLYISTSYVRVRDIMPHIHEIAMTNRLALYDAETDRIFFKSLFDDTFINLRIRERELKDRILNEAAPVWRIRKISEYQDERDKQSCYSVTLLKDINKPFTKRVKDFYECLKSNLGENEGLFSEDRSFTVHGEWYSITYVLEGYKKHANMVGYYERGYPQQGLTGRMSVEEAFKWMDGCCETEKDDIFDRMNFYEMEDVFPNPADRLACSVRLTKWLKKHVPGVRYSGIGYYGSEILFHIVPSDCYQDHKNISVLKIEEETASLILAFIQDHYPYFQARYFSENYIPLEMLRDIIKRIKEAKDWVLHDTYNPEYKKYIDCFDLFELGASRDDDSTDFVYAHRYEIAKLYEVFIQWSELQIKYFGTSGDERMFNIQGP